MSEAEPIPPTSSVTALRIPMIMKDARTLDDADLKFLKPTISFGMYCYNDSGQPWIDLIGVDDLYNHTKKQRQYYKTKVTAEPTHIPKDILRLPQARCKLLLTVLPTQMKSYVPSLLNKNYPTTHGGYDNSKVIREVIMRKTGRPIDLKPKNGITFDKNIALLDKEMDLVNFDWSNKADDTQCSSFDGYNTEVKLEKWSNASVLQNEVLNKQRYLSDKTCIGFGVESSSGMESDNSSGNTNSTDSLYPNFQKTKGFHSVPPPTGTIIPPRANVSFTGIDELAIRNKVLNQENTKSSQPEIDRNKVIIEDWVDSDDEETDFSEIQKKTVFNSENSETSFENKYSETSFENKSPNSQNSVGQGSRKMGVGHKGGKLCFVCYSPNHLIKDCNFHERTFNQTQTHKPKGTQGSRDTRPVWNNINRVNHSNFSRNSRYPHQRKSFIPSAVLTREGLKSTAKPKLTRTVPLKSTANVFYQGTARPKVHHAVLSQSTGRPYYPRMDNTRPRTSSLSRTPHRPQRPKKIVKSIWVKKGSTVGSQAVLPQTVKKSAMIKSNQTWRPKGAYLDSVNRDNGSYTLKQFEYGNPEEDLKDYAIIDSGCSGSMTGDKDKLSDFKEFKGGYVAFGNDSKGGRISGKGTIKTSCIDFEKVSYVEELKFNLLSVSQICDKKHNVLFTDKECLILSPKFKFVDEDLVILRAPRKNDVYSLDLKNIIPSGGITCLVAKATKDEAVLWHRRLGHVNFKNINKLVKGNLVRGLPSKTFKLDHSCLACRKGKQHRASCKKIEERTVREPLELLHMDLFGPVSVESVNRKKYCLVVTDDCSKFSWVFFLAYKDETYDMLHDLIVGLENKLRHKVKTIRCDHGTEFKNQLMNEFCAKKGIKREYSIARTPQQNGVAERKNRTLIEAARTMLADSLLPIQFWAEAVNTACYVLNRVLVTKPQMKTPYEILMGRSPNISFMRPFGCPLTILNTLDHLGKFDGKSEEGYLLGYSTNSKGFRVYNRVTRKVQDCLHVNFLENQENQKGKGPDWMFDLELLTPSMNYIPVRKENYADSGGNVSTLNDVEDLDDQQFIVHTAAKEVPLSSEEQALHDELVSLMHQESLAKLHNDAQRTAFEKEKKRIALEKGKECVDSTFTLSTANTPPQSTGNTPTDSDDDTPTDGVFSTNSFDAEEGGVADYNNLDSTIDVPSTPTLRIHKIHPQSQIIGKSTAGVQTRRKLQDSTSNQHQALLSFIYKQNRTNHKDQQTCLFACFLSQEEPKKVSQALADESWVEAMQEELLQFKLQEVWVLCDLPEGKRVIGTKWVFRNKRDERGTIIKNKARLVAQGYRQEEGVDYDEVFAPVARIEAIRLFLAFASFMGFLVYQMDVKSAFLYGNITEEVIHKIHPQSQIIGKSTAGVLTRRKLKESTSDQHQALLSFIYKQNRTNHKDQQTCLFACFLSQKEPKKVSQALSNESWVEAMQEELLQFKLQDVWVLCDLPDGKRVIGTKWVFRNKRDERGTIIKNKARLVAQGYRQEEGVDYDEVFAPVARIEAIRLFLAFASFMGFTVYQMDVKSAFLYGNITEEVYVKQPPGFEDPAHPNNLQSSQGTLWLTSSPKSMVYVDDIIFGSTKPSMVKDFEELMQKEFKMSYKGKDEEGEDVDVHLYRSMIGCLMYLTASRPDIMFVVCLCARFQVTPKVSHMHAVKRIFRYLKHQPKLGLWYPKDSPFHLEAFSDSDYAGDNHDRRSTSGGCQYLGRRLVSWQCKKQTIVAISSTEAEYVAAASCCAQVLWMQNQLLDYGFNFMNTEIHIDNESTICIVKNPVLHSKTKHIQIRHHFIRDCYEQRLINVVKVHTDDNVADLLTKGFDLARFNFLVVTIGMMNP
ncbi:putative ribonuclease H-like domain-containing protein [Tanacetum coccineum]